MKVICLFVCHNNLKRRSETYWQYRLTETGNFAMPGYIKVFLNPLHPNTKQFNFPKSNCWMVFCVMLNNISFVVDNFSFSTQESRPFFCECGRRYKYRTGLLQHRLYECNKEPQFSCQFCPFKSKRNSSLKYHVVSKHKSSI